MCSDEWKVDGSREDAGRLRLRLNPAQRSIRQAHPLQVRWTLRGKTENRFLPAQRALMLNFFRRHYLQRERGRPASLIAQRHSADHAASREDMLRERYLQP